MDEGQNVLLNRILEELRGLRVDIKSIETEHGAFRERLTKLEEDRINRESAAKTRTAYVCAFGGVVIAAIIALFSNTFDNKSRLDSINSYGTAYGRGREDVYLRRFEEDEKRLAAVERGKP